MSDAPPRKPRKTGRALKAKGDNFERELAAHINQRIPGLQCQRAPLSGGGFVGGLSGGADLMGTPGIHIEAKRVERVNLIEALRQAEASIAKTNAPEHAIVVNRRNRQSTGESYATLRLDFLLELYSSWLREHGHI
jgi:hypothetical protein